MAHVAKIEPCNATAPAVPGWDRLTCDLRADHAGAHHAVWPDLDGGRHTVEWVDAIADWHTGTVRVSPPTPPP